MWTWRASAGSLGSSVPKPRREENIGLPSRWQIEHGAYFYRVPTSERTLWGDRSRVRLGTTLVEATEFFEPRKALVDAGLPAKTERAEGSAIFKAALWHRIGYTSACGIPLGMLQSIFSTARAGALSRGLAYPLHPLHLVKLSSMAAGHCMLTGIAWDFTTKNANGKRPWTPSLDRIDAMQGYEPANCRLVCTAVNLALSDFGDAVLRRIARALLAFRMTQTAAVTQTL